MISGQILKKIQRAIVDTFTTVPAFRMFLRASLDRHLDAIAVGDSFAEVGFKVAENSVITGWIRELVTAATEYSPSSLEWQQIAQVFGLKPFESSVGTAELVVRNELPFLDVATWRQTLERLETAVCRIRVPNPAGSALGTGFLIGPDLILTNHHVVFGRANTKPPESVIVEFDYKNTATALAADNCKAITLAGDNWLIAISPRCYEHFADPPTYALDFAVLRLPHKVAASSIKNRHNSSVHPARHWIPLSRREHNPRAGDPLLIVQHPDGDPMAIAFDTSAVISISKGGAGLIYRTNTLPGSSGSPCFSQNFELLAQHHSGSRIKPGNDYNTGTYVNALADSLQGKISLSD